MVVKTNWRPIRDADRRERQDRLWIGNRRFADQFVFLVENLIGQGYDVYQIGEMLDVRPRHVKGAVRLGEKMQAIILSEKNAVRFRKRDAHHRRRAERLGGASEPIDLWEVWLRSRGRCHLCGNIVSPDEVDFDHIMPLSRGGDHVEANLAVAHSFCNRSKGAKVAA